MSDVAKGGALLSFLYSEKGKEFLGVVGKGRHYSSVGGMVGSAGRTHVRNRLHNCVVVKIKKIWV